MGAAKCSGCNDLTAIERGLCVWCLAVDELDEDGQPKSAVEAQGADDGDDDETAAWEDWAESMDGDHASALESAGYGEG